LQPGDGPPGKKALKNKMQDLPVRTGTGGCAGAARR